VLLRLGLAVGLLMLAPPAPDSSSSVRFDQCPTDPPPDSICAQHATGGSGGGGAGGGSSGPVRPCKWQVMPYSMAWEDRDSLAVAAYFRLSNGGLGRTLVDGTTQHGKRWVCTDDNSIGPPVWTNVTSLHDLVNGSVVSVSRRVPVPGIAVNPSPETGGVVNLGMWLAVSNAEPISVRAGNDTMWAQTTAELASTRWEMGNGDVVDCDGPGVALSEHDPGWDELDQGPCGYTYSEQPPDEPYRVSVTATWSVTWTTSAGTRGNADPIVLATSFDYTTIEIQTIGITG
jgi:hypothetical protein